MDASSKFRKNLPTTPENLIESLDELGLSTTIYKHPPLFTVKDAKKHQKNMVGLHVKNLFLRDKKKNNFLIVAEQDAEINLKTLHTAIGSDRLSFGSSERLFQFLGIMPGAVSPLALTNDKNHEVKLIFDKNLTGDKRLHFHPLVNDITLGITYGDLLKFLNATGHPIKTIDLDNLE